MCTSLQVESMARQHEQLGRLHLALQLEGYSTAESHTGFMRVFARVILNGQLDLKQSPLFRLCEHLANLSKRFLCS